jgi:hypothetical protein
MNDNTKDIAAKVAEEILRNLHGRKGVGDELDEIEPEIYEEMFDDLVETAFRVLGKHFYFGELYIKFTPEEGKAFVDLFWGMDRSLGPGAEDFLEQFSDDGYAIPNKVSAELPK